jgi:hypothetical protein
MALRSAALSALAGAACLLAVHDAGASVQIAVVFDALVRDSAAVDQVTCVEQKSLWENGRIYTYSRVVVQRTLAGDTRGEAWVRTLGGVVGDVGQIVDGEAVLQVGKPTLLFLHATPNAGVYEVTARAQGQFVLAADGSGRVRLRAGANVGALLAPQEKTMALVRTQARAPLTPEATMLARDVAAGKTVDDLAKDVALAWTRTHAR